MGEVSSFMSFGHKKAAETRWMLHADDDAGSTLITSTVPYGIQKVQRCLDLQTVEEATLDTVENALDQELLGMLNT